MKKIKNDLRNFLDTETFRHCLKTMGLGISLMALSSQLSANAPTAMTAEQYNANLASVRALEQKANDDRDECLGPTPSPQKHSECDVKHRADLSHADHMAERLGVQSTRQAAARGTTQAQAASAANENLECQKIADAISTSLRSSFEASPDKDRGLPGSDDLDTCTKMTNLEWKDAVSSNRPDIWNKGWKDFTSKLAQDITSGNNNCGQTKSALDSIRGKTKNFIDTLSRCEAIRTITAKSDFNNQKLMAGGKSSIQKSLDQKITCTSSGIETQDYVPCEKTLTFYNSALVGQTVFTQVQELGYQGHAIENSVLDPNDPTAGLKAQQKDIQKRAGMTQTRAGLDVAKGAALLALWNTIPTYKEVLDRDCNPGKYSNAQRNIVAGFDQYQNSITGVLRSPGMPQGLGTAPFDVVRDLAGIKSSILPSHMASQCKKHVEGQHVLRNQQAKDAIKEAMILAGIDGVKHLTAANLLKKQANQVGKVINEVDNFNPTGLEYFGEEFNGNECSLNPAAEGCDDFLNKRSFGFGQTAPIQIHGMENASMFGRNETDDGTGTRDAASSPVDRTDAPKPIGIFDANADNPSGLLDRTRAASVTSDGAAAPAGGGGGGSGVGGGGSPPGAPGGGAAASDAPRMGLPGAGNSNLAYSRGTGAIRGMGGSGAQGARSRDGSVENPFAGLFGQDGAQGSSLNFREGASDDGQINQPDTSIFQIISDRYIAVHQNDRLLMYEAQEEQGPLR